MILAQLEPTIGEVFDFEIGDKFQKHITLPSVPPHATRIEIIDKYYSSDGLTVNYVRSFDNYSSIVVWEPEPYLEYSTSTYTDTIQYSDLDSLITYMEADPIALYSSYVSSFYCDSLVYSYIYNAASDFEPEIHEFQYSRGLGEVETSYYPTEPLDSPWSVSVFYYEKNGVSCGTPDTFIVGIDDLIKDDIVLEVYPNPTDGLIKINSEWLQFKEIELFKSDGVLVKKIEGNRREIDISDLSSGLYFLHFITVDNRAFSKNIIKE